MLTVKFRIHTLITPILVFLGTQTTAQELNPSDLKKLSIEELMNLEVTLVSKTPQRLSGAASAIQVITAEDIRRSGVNTLPEALRLLPNMQVAKVNASQWAISVRGFNNVLADKLLVMIDGRTVYTPMYAGTFWDAQNVLLEDVEKIEVISGPGGTLWGANAVNGVINIITKSADKSQGLFAEVGAGSQIPWMANLRYGGKINDKVHYRIYGLGYKQADTKLTDGNPANDKWSLGQGGFRVDWQAGIKDLVTVQGDFYDGFPNPDGNTAVVALGTNLLARWTRNISDKSDFHMQAYYDYTSRDFRNGFAQKLNTFDVDWQYRFAAGKNHEFVWGGDIRVIDDRVNNLELFRFDPAHKNLHIYSTFIQDKITLVPSSLYFTVGSKIEHNVYTGFEYSPSGRLAWTPKENQTLWAAVSRAVRTPSRIDEEFHLYAIPELPIITGSATRSQTLLAYELGWRFRPLDKLSLSLATFYHDYDHLRSAEPGDLPGGFPITFANGVEGHSYGAELSGTWQPQEWWRVRGGYTFMKKELSVKSDSKDLNNASAESNDPVNQVLVQSMFDIRKRFEAGFVVRYIDALPMPEVPSYVGLDIQLTWNINKNFQLGVTGQNLLDDRHPEFIPTSPSAREILRGFNGKLTCRF